MDISRGLKVAQLLAGFPDGITLYVDRPFIPREYQCFSWLGTAPSVYLCNLRACWLLHRDESVPIIERGMEVDTVLVAGIDVSKRFSDLCILSPENQVFSSTRIYHDKTSMDRARDLLLKAQAEFGHAFALMEIIEQLPSVQRSAITLYYMDGYSINDISDLMNTPTGTIKSRLKAGRDKLYIHIREDKQENIG